MYDEFKVLDVNNDGMISIEEIIQFLTKKSGGKVDTRIAEELFEEIDADHSGRVSL